MDRLANYKRCPFTVEQLQLAGRYLTLLDVGWVKPKAKRLDVLKSWVALRDLHAKESEREWVDVLDVLEKNRCELNAKPALRECILGECPWLQKVKSDREAWEVKVTRRMKRVRLKMNSPAYSENYSAVRGAELESERLSKSGEPYKICPCCGQPIKPVAKATSKPKISKKKRRS
jgi:hypothetical protein